MGVPLAEIAAILGGHPNTARHHLRRLIEDGLAQAEREKPHGRGRPGMLFLATRAGRGALRRGPGGAVGHYLTLAGAFAERLARETDPREVSRAVGHSWGESLVAAQADEGTGDAAVPRVGEGRAPSAGTVASVGAGDGASAAAAPPVDAAEGPSERVAHMLDGLGFAPEALPEPGTFALTQCPLLDAAKRHPDVVCEVHTGLIEAAHAAFGGSGKARLEAFARPGACVLRLGDASLDGSAG